MVSHIFNFHPYLGRWSNLTNTFQMGWNHQLGKDLRNTYIAEVAIGTWRYPQVNKEDKNLSKPTTEPQMLLTNGHERWWFHGNCISPLACLEWFFISTVAATSCPGEPGGGGKGQQVKSCSRILVLKRWRLLVTRTFFEGGKGVHLFWGDDCYNALFCRFEAYEPKVVARSVVLHKKELRNLRIPPKNNG